MTALNVNKIMKLTFFVRFILLLFISLCCTTSAEKPSKLVVESGTINTTELRIAWTGSADNFNVTTYFAGNSSEFRTDPNATSPFLVVNLTPGQSYYFIVTAFNETVTEPSERSDTATTVPSKPTTPTVEAGATDTTEIKVSWTYTGVADDFTITTQINGIASSPGPITANGSPHTVTGLTPGEVYTFTVTANSGGKSGDASDPSAPARTVPSKPTTPTVEAGATDTTEIKVSWTYTDVADDFTITTQINGIASSPGPITANGSPHTVTGLTPGEVYTFTVTANSGGKSGDASDPSAPARTVPSKPTTPTVEAGATDTTEIKVSWTYTDVADDFTITTQINGIASSPGPITANGSPHTVTGLTPGEVYTFTVTANSGGKSGDASDPSAPARTVPSKPTTPTVEAGATDTTEIKVSWTYTDVADDFTITTQINGIASSPGPITANGSPHTVTGLTPGEVYTFTVTANSGGKSGDASDPSAPARTVPSKPTTPTVEAGATDTTKIKVSWTYTGVADDFTITTQINGIASSPGPITANGSPHTVTGLTPGEVYTFTVTANSGGKSGDASDPSVPARTIPSQPGKPTVVADTTDNTSKLILSWTYPDTDVADKFTITTQATGSSSISDPIAVDGSKRTHTVSDLIPGEEYTFRVTARSGDKNGTASDPSDSTRTVPSQPPKPTVKPGTNTSTEVKVSWIYTHVADKFTITTQTTGSSSIPDPIAVDGSKRTHTVSCLIPGEEYIFTVTARSGDKNGSASVPSDLARTAPMPPSDLILFKAGFDYLQVNWSLPTGGIFDSQFLTVKNSSGVASNQTLSNTTTSSNISELTSGAVYEITIVVISFYVSSDPLTRNFTTEARGVTGISAANQTISTIFVQWNPPGNTKVDKYQFSYSRIDMFSTPMNTTTMNLTDPYYEITSLAAGTLYRIEVSFINSNKISDPVSTDLATTPLNARNVTASTLTNTSVSISWLKPFPGGYHQFIVVAYNDSGSVEQNTTVSNSSFSSQLSKLTPGSYFTVTVQVEYFGVKSSSSDAKVSTKPDPVSMLSVLEKSHSTNPNVTWSPPLLGSTDHYIITYKFPNDTLLWNDTVVGTATNYDHVLVQGNGYLVFVTTVFAGFKGSSVNKSSTIYPDSAKSLTVERATANPTNQLFLSWGKPSGNGHHIIANCSGNCVSPTHNFGFEDTNGTIPVKPGENYTITVFVISFQNLQSNKTMQRITSQPSKPTVTVTPNIESIDLKWSIAGNVEYFEIYYDGASNPNSMVTVPMSERSYSIQKLWPATEYTIRVQAVVTDVNSARLPSAKYSAAQLTNSAAPPMPNNTRLASSSASTSSISFVLPKNTFSDKSGPILLYGVYLSSPNRRDLTEPDQSKNDSCDAFASGSVRECVALWADNPGNLITPSSRKRRSYNNPQWNDDITFTIGSGESTVSPWQTNYVNSPLTADSEYIVAICAKTSNPTFACTTWSDPIRTQVAATTTGLIVGVVLGVIAAIVLLFVLIFFYRKKQKKQSNRDISMPAVSESAVYVNVVEVPNSETTTSVVKEQFKKLSQVGSNNTSKVAKIPANKEKNRDVNLLPYDSSRVVLLSIIGKSDSDYINASYIPGKSHNKEYIATQGVLRNTMDDFWRMIWEQKCSVIVLLTNLREKGDIVCEQYWPESDDPVVIQTTMTLKLLSSKYNKNGFRVREFNLLRDGDNHVVQQFHFTAWTDEAKPSSEFLESFVKFVTAVRDEVKTSSPIVVQCCNGGGRSEVFITVDQLLQTINPSSSDDIFDIVKTMREHRPCMIDSEDQYLLLHKIVEQLVGHQYEQITLPGNDGKYQNVVVEDGKRGYAQYDFMSPAGDDGGYANVLPTP